MLELTSDKAPLKTPMFTANHPVVFGDLSSGNLHKVQLILSMVGQSFNRVQLSQLAGHTQDSRFTKLNPFGKYPLVLLEDGTLLRESAAILFYFGKSTPLWPDSTLAQTRVLQWMFFEQYTHEPCLAVYRYKKCFLKSDNHGELASLRDACEKVLQNLDREIKSSDFITGSKVTLADIALYPYTYAISDTDLNLADYPALNAWSHRVESLENFVPLGRDAAHQTLSFNDYFKE